MRHLAFIQHMHSQLDEAGKNAHEWEIRSLQIVGSTSTRVEHMLGLYEKVIVLSQTQTQGRGRQQKIWYSPSGGLWLSFGFLCDTQVIELSTPIIEEIHKVLSQYVECDIKHPNDIMINGKKVCGMLVETKVQANRLKRVIVGIGINVDNELPEEIANLATRLKDHMEDTPDLHELGSSIVIQLLDCLGILIPDL